MRNRQAIPPALVEARKHTRGLSHAMPRQSGIMIDIDGSPPVASRAHIRLRVPGGLPAEDSQRRGYRPVTLCVAVSVLLLPWTLARYLAHAQPLCHRYT